MPRTEEDQNFPVQNGNDFNDFGSNDNSKSRRMQRSMTYPRQISRKGKNRKRPALDDFNSELEKVSLLAIILIKSFVNRISLLNKLSRTHSQWITVVLNRDRHRAARPGHFGDPDLCRSLVLKRVFKKELINNLFSIKINNQNSVYGNKRGQRFVCFKN